MPGCEVDTTRDPASVGLWPQGMNSCDVVATHDTDTRGAFQGLTQDSPAARREETNVEVIAAQERHERHVEPGSVSRTSEQRDKATEGHHMRQGLPGRIGREHVPQALQSVRDIVVQRAGEITSLLLALKCPGLGPGRKVDDVNAHPQGTEGLHKTVTRARHAALARVIVLSQPDLGSGQAFEAAQRRPCKPGVLLTDRSGADVTALWCELPAVAQDKKAAFDRTLRCETHACPFPRRGVTR